MSRSIFLSFALVILPINVFAQTCRPQVKEYCSKNDCSLFFDQNAEPFDPWTVAPEYMTEISNRLGDIREAAKTVDIDEKVLIGVLIVANVKLPVLGSGIRGNAGLSSGLDSGLSSGQRSGLDSGKRETPFLNLGRLDHGGEILSEKFLSALQKRPERNEAEVWAAIENGEDILYAAALVARNKQVFESIGLNYDVAIAATLFFFEDVLGTAKKVRSENREPQPNSFGLYAECQGSVIDNLLK